MKKWTLAILLAGAIGLSAQANVTTSETQVKAENASFWLGPSARINGWRAVSRDELIVWATSSRPYLLKIWRPARSLKFVNTIGLTSTGGRVSTFDYVVVEGQRLPIKSIVELDKEAAKTMRWQSD